MKSNLYLKKFPFGLVILLLAGLCLPALGVEPHQDFAEPSATGPPPAALLPFLPKDLPAGSYYLDYVKVPPEEPSRGRGLLVAAYGYWEKGRPLPHSRILVVGFEPATSLPKLLWRSEEEDMYAPQVTLEPRLLYDNRPIVLVYRSVGLMLSHVDVLGFRNQQPRLLWTKENQKFELIQFSPGTASVLLEWTRMVISCHYFFLPEVLEWNGEKFVEASHKYPHFFEELTLKKDRDPIDIAILTALAGRRSDAMLQMEEIFRSEQNKHGYEAEIERILNVLKSKPGPYFVRDFQ